MIAAPPRSVPGIVKTAGEKGVAAAVIITAGLGHGAGSLAEACEKAARATGLRLVGPNCLGVLSPRAKLNASFAARMPPAGDLALISQSGAIAAGLVEWAAAHGIGFSAVVSLGDRSTSISAICSTISRSIARTRAILLYIESINDARKFMSAARAAARIKPVVVVKSGRHAQGAKAAQTHTGALAGSDAVYDAAFRRAGLLRVIDLDELFAAAETLGRVRPFSGKRLAILTNGGGHRRAGGRPAGRSRRHARRHFAGHDARSSMRRCRRSGRRANPVDIIGDADRRPLRAALEALLADPDERRGSGDECADRACLGADGAPGGRRRGAGASQQRGAGRSRSWPSGSAPAMPSRRSSKPPAFRITQTESDAVRGFMHLVRYREAQDA